MAKGADNDRRQRVVVLGAGIAGLAAAKQLVEAGYDVTVIERSGQCGGAHRSANIGPYTFDIGSIFYEENARLFALSQGLEDLCPKVMRQQRRIAPDGSLLHYPLSPREVLRTQAWRVPLGVLDMLSSRLFVRLDGSLDAISRKRLGSIFFEDTGLAAYIARFNHVPPVEIDERFFFKRMGFVEKATRMGNLLEVGSKLFFSDKGFKTPRKPLYIRPQEGFAALFDPIRAELEQAGVTFRFNQDIAAIERSDGRIILRAGDEHYETDTLVSTVPLTTLYKAMFGEQLAISSLDMTTLFVSAKSLDRQTGNVLFNFHGRGSWKRATIYSRLYPEADTDRDFFGVEVTIPPGGPHDPEGAFADFRDHITDLGLAEDLQLEGSAFNEAAYPLYLKDSDAVLERALERVTQAGIISVGRQGRFEYLPTSTGVIRRVGEELDKALSATGVETAAQ